MEKEIKLGVEKVALYEEDEGYYLRISIIVKEGNKLCRRTYPKVSLGTFLQDMSIREENKMSLYSFDASHKLIIDGNEFMLKPGRMVDDDTSYKYTVKSELIHEEVKEMTIEEIEKKLGYKVKIIGKGE